MAAASTRHDRDVGKNALTRREAGVDLGVSIATLRRWERAGVLHPFTHGGLVRYRGAEVAGLVARRQRDALEHSDGAIAARVFARFDGGEHSLPAIVQAEKLAPSVVRALWAEYSAPLGRAPVVPVAAPASATRRAAKSSSTSAADDDAAIDAALLEELKREERARRGAAYDDDDDAADD